MVSPLELQVRAEEGIASSPVQEALRDIIEGQGNVGLLAELASLYSVLYSVAEREHDEVGKAVYQRLRTSVRTLATSLPDRMS